ncbi:MAG: ribosome biogenesis GTPase Der [Fidelibacterota bacterium]
MGKPVIAIVGRPNVGKSTLFNRLLKQRKAIVDPIEGITRDRIYGEVEWTGRQFTFIDTGGYIPDDKEIMNTAVRAQAGAAIQEAELILFMVDGKTGPTAVDRNLAQFIRETSKPAILVVNKCDALHQDEQVHAFHELGVEPLMPLSALNGRLTGDLLDRVLEILKLPAKGEEPEEPSGLRLAIVGMPNVGKSSLMNALLQKEQSIVTPIAGTTRDSIDTTLKWYGKQLTLVDTAGLRKRSRVKDSIEFYSSVRAIRAVEHCNVALVLIDAQKGFGKQDKSIVEMVIKQGKGLVLVVNKWDLVEKDAHTMSEFSREIAYQFKALEHYPILYVSALTRQRISRVLEQVYAVYEARQSLISTAKLNTFLQQAVRQKEPSAVQGKVIKLNYMVQVHQAPPVFAIFTNYPLLIPRNYRRYLENRLREAFQFSGVPVKLSFRKK